MEIIIDDKTGAEIVVITNEDGTTLSMLKSTYDEQQAQAALSTAIGLTDNYLTTPAIMESTQPDEADLTEGTN
tara:strand:+ start:2903 stop:3121 length:219 start_codon:yes stop_codon:yes gene_type:complete